MERSIVSTGTSQPKLPQTPPTTIRLRFAPIIRVSTEKQKRKGESLRTQKKQIERAVEYLRGIIPEHCWKYSGQEHATPGQEREKLKTLLQDSAKGLFDAVIACDVSRWSRDNASNKEGLEILKKNGIKFFIDTTEYDLYSPQAAYFLGMSTEMNEFVAMEQSRKSMLNRIERAKRGVPSSGKMPYGRTFNKTTGKWEIVQEKAKNIIWAAKRYLQGEGLPKIAFDLGMNAANLWKVLTRRSGENWEIAFESKRLNISEVVQLKIPVLLPPDTINAILEKAKANKTYTHGEIKYKYLLSRMIFCGHCGCTLSGQTLHEKRSYYRHKQRKKKCAEGNCLKWIRAEDMEKAVLIQVLSMFGNVKKMERAIARATPTLDKVNELEREKNFIEKKIKKIAQQKNNLIEAVADGKFSHIDIKAKMEKLREEEQSFVDRRTVVVTQLENIPTKASIQQTVKRYAVRKAVIRDAFSRASSDCLRSMSYDDKRQLIEHAFSGKDAEGKRLGVYVKPTGKKDTPWTYTIKGTLSEVEGRLPMDKGEAQDLLHIDTDYSDENPLDVPIASDKTKFTLSLQEQGLPGFRFPSDISPHQG